MAKITLNDLTTNFGSQTLHNTNNAEIESHLNSKVLYRDNPEGEPNQMETPLDMNSFRILNLPDASSAQEPITKSQLDAASNSTVFDPSISAYTGAGTTTSSRTVSSRLDDVYSVKNWGVARDGTTDDTAKIQAAIDEVAALGGGTILLPAGDYHCKRITISGDRIHLLGYGARLIDLTPSSQADATRITITPTSDSCTIEGLTIFTTHTTGQNWNTDIAGTNVRLINYTVTRDDPEQEGNVGLYLRAADGVDMIGCRFETGNFIWTSAKNVRISNCHLHGGGDDGIAIKASTQNVVTENIVITNCTFKNFTNMVALGTEVQEGAVIRRVALSNCVGDNVGSIIWAKPGRTDVNYRDGTIRDVHVSNCHSTLDVDTAVDVRLSSLLWIDCDNGGKVYNVNVENCSLKGRWNNDPVGSRFGLLLIDTNGDIAGSGSIREDDTVDGVTMTNCHWIDTYNGAANGVAAPGYPIDGIGNITMSADTQHTIKNIKLVDCTANGSELLGFGIGTNGNTGTEFGQVELIRPKFINVATAPITVDQAAGIRSKVKTTIKDAEISMGTGTTVAISSTDINDTSGPYESEEFVFNFGDISAGSNRDEYIFIAQYDGYLSMLDLLVGTTVPQNATNRATFTLSNATTSDTIVSSRSTNVGALDLQANTRTAIIDDAVFTDTGAWFSKGDVFRLVVGSTGSGQTLDRLNVIGKFVYTNK